MPITKPVVAMAECHCSTPAGQPDPRGLPQDSMFACAACGQTWRIVVQKAGSRIGGALPIGGGLWMGGSHRTGKLTPRWAKCGTNVALQRARQALAAGPRTATVPTPGEALSGARSDSRGGREDRRQARADALDYHRVLAERSVGARHRDRARVVEERAQRTFRAGERRRRALALRTEARALLPALLAAVVFVLAVAGFAAAMLTGHGGPAFILAVTVGAFLTVASRERAARRAARPGPAPGALGAP